MKMSAVLNGIVVVVDYRNTTNCKVVLKDYTSKNPMTGFVGTPKQCADFVSRKTGELFILV